jgi:hypothetical protein
MKIYIGILLIIQINCSFWTEIPQRCIYDQTTLFLCWNTSFIKPIPLFNDRSYTIQNHQVDIRDSNFQLSLIDLFANVGGNIEHLILINNTFSSNLFNESTKIYFRLLQTIQICDNQGLQWMQLNSSYFPQLIKLDLSYNQFTNEKQLVLNFQTLKYLDLSHNQLETIENLSGNSLDRIEILILSFNPLKTIMNKIKQFQSLRILDLSFTPIKQLFSITLLSRLEIFHCRQCQQISMFEYEKFLFNCSHNLIVNLSETKISSLKFFNPFIQCFKDLTINNQSMNTSEDILLATNLENIQLQAIEKINSIHLNIYDRFKSIDFSENKNLQQVHLRLMSDYTYLQRLKISHTRLNDFAVDFNNTRLKFLHIDMIDMSDNHLESLDFLQYLTFSSLDLSFNRLKIISIEYIHYRHGMYELFQMNLLNLSFNQMESGRIHWDNESPHTIDLSNNNLQNIELHGQTTYTLLVNNNPELSVIPKTFSIDFPFLQYLSLNSIQFDSFENLIYLHNLSNIHTLSLDDNQLRTEHRTLNWNVFYPWCKHLKHLSLKNMSIEKIDPGIYLNDFGHLLTIDFYENNFECNCILQPFINWLKVPPPPLPDFYEPLNKVLSLECPLSLFNMQCDDRQMKLTLFIVLLLVGVSLIILLVMIKLLIKRKRSKPYDRMFIDNDTIALNETNFIQKTDDDE